MRNSIVRIHMPQRTGCSRMPGSEIAQERCDKHLDRSMEEIYNLRMSWVAELEFVICRGA